MRERELSLATLHNPKQEGHRESRLANDIAHDAVALQVVSSPKVSTTDMVTVSSSFTAFAT